MAELSDNQRDGVWSEWMQANHEPVNIEKAAVRQAVADIDGWIEAQLVGALAALQEPAASGLSVDQKFDLFNRIVRARVE